MGDIKEVRDVLGKEKRFWDRYGGYGSGPGILEKEEKEFIERIIKEAVEGKRVLNPACFGGRWMEFLQKLGAREVVGLDISDWYSELARDKFKGKKGVFRRLASALGSLVSRKKKTVWVDVVQGDASVFFPFRPGAFDVIFSHEPLPLLRELEGEPDDITLSFYLHLFSVPTSLLLFTEPLLRPAVEKAKKQLEELGGELGAEVELLESPSGSMVIRIKTPEEGRRKAWEKYEELLEELKGEHKPEQGSRPGF